MSCAWESGLARGASDRRFHAIGRVTGGKNDMASELQGKTIAILAADGV